MERSLQLNSISAVPNLWRAQAAKSWLPGCKMRFGMQPPPIFSALQSFWPSLRRFGMDALSSAVAVEMLSATVGVSTLTAAFPGSTLSLLRTCVPL